jgi:uncharacterized protein
MIQRRVLVTLMAIAAVAGCKKSESKPAPTTTATAPTPAPAPATAVPAGSGSAIDSSPAPGAAITRPFFYKVEKDGKTSYLIGTWHLGVDAEKQLPPAVWDAFAAAKTFAMETDPDEAAQLAGFKRTDGKTLEDELGAEHWAKLEALYGPNAAVLKPMKTGMALWMLQAKDLPRTEPMDAAFLTRAKTAKKQLAFLEPAAVQLKLLDTWMDVRLLKHTIDDYDATKQVLADGMVAYMIGDDAALVAIAMDRPSMKAAGYTDAEIDQAMTEMLFDRNAAWIAKLDTLFAAGDAFVAVGAAHLIGSRSVVELLSAKGYTVTRLGA